MYKNLSNWLTSILLIISGTISILITLSGIFEWNITFLINTTDNFDTIILGIIGILSLAIGSERILNFKQIEKNIKNFEELFHSYLGGRELLGYEEIYHESIRLIRITNEHIRTIIYSNGPKAPDEFVKTVISRMKELNNKNISVKYDVVLALNFDNISANFKEKNDLHIERFKKEGLKDNFSLYMIDVKQFIGLDVLIIDSDHVLLGFPTIQKIIDLQRGIVFEKQPQLTKKFVDWFDQVVLKAAIQYEEWLKNQFG